MKRTTTFIIALLISTAGQSQGLLKGLRKKAEEAATNIVIKKGTEAAEKGLGQQGAQPGAKDPPSNMPAPAGAVSFNGLQEAYRQYSFVPGQQLLFTDDFEQDRTGDIPAQWFTNTSAEVVEINNVPGKWVKVGKGSFLSPTWKLPADFTCEFDVLINLPTVTTAVYPGLTFELFDRGDKLKKVSYNSYSINNLLVFSARFHQKFATIQLDSRENARSKLKTEKIELPGFQQNYGRVVHVALACRGERLQLWLNAAKVMDLPAAVAKNHHFNQLSVNGATTGEGDPAFYFGNFKVAGALPDIRSTLLNEGHYSTTAVRFDPGSDQLKHESYGTLKEIAAVMSEKPGATLTITGHTDNKGKADNNLVLSEKRAAAVKAILVNDFGIAEGNIKTKGSGSAMPIADNETLNGQAENRRVEFFLKAGK